MWNKLLNNATEFGEKFSLLSTMGKIATVAALMYLTFMIGTCSKNPSTDNISVAVRQTREYTSKLENEIKTLQDSVGNREAVIQELKVEISLRKQSRSVVQNRISMLDSLAERERELTPTPFTDTLIYTLKTQIASADSIIELQDSVIVEREEQIRLLKKSLVLSTTRGDTLQLALNNVLREYQKKDKLFGKIPLPSRKTVAAVALVGGVYLGASAMR